MDPPDPCKRQVHHRPITPTDVVAHPQPVNVHGICETPAPTYWHLVAALLRWSEAAHETLGCRGATRADFRYDPDSGRIAILEVNTQPGLTPLSLLPEQALATGMDFTTLVTWMVENAACDA